MFEMFLMIAVVALVFKIFKWIINAIKAKYRQKKNEKYRKAWPPKPQIKKM